MLYSVYHHWSVSCYRCDYKIPEFLKNTIISCNKWVCADIKQILSEAQHRWLRPAEICEILRNYQKFHITPEPPLKPVSTFSSFNDLLIVCILFTMCICPRISMISGCQNYAKIMSCYKLFCIWLRDKLREKCLRDTWHTCSLSVPLPFTFFILVYNAFAYCYFILISFTCSCIAMTSFFYPFHIWC